MLLGVKVVAGCQTVGEEVVVSCEVVYWDCRNRSRLFYLAEKLWENL